MLQYSFPVSKEYCLRLEQNSREYIRNGKSQHGRYLTGNYMPELIENVVKEEEHQVPLVATNAKLTFYKN